MNSRYSVTILLVLILVTTKSGAAQGTENVIKAGMVSYFTAGFAILFAAIFGFSFTLRTILNQQSKKWSSKQILIYSLRISFILSLVILIALFAFLNS